MDGSECRLFRFRSVDIFDSDRSTILGDVFTRVTQVSRHESHEHSQAMTETCPELPIELWSNICTFLSDCPDTMWMIMATCK
jgi:hypothetical protein